MLLEPAAIFLSKKHLRGHVSRGSLAGEQLKNTRFLHPGLQSFHPIGMFSLLQDAPTKAGAKPVLLDGNAGRLLNHAKTGHNGVSRAFSQRHAAGLHWMATTPTNGLATMTDPELVGLAKSGQMDAFDELVNRHERKIFRLTQHITGNREDAQDALQETFLKAFSRLSQFQGDSQFYTWLVRIAVNESLMKLRKGRAHPTVSLDEPIETDDDLIPRELGTWDRNPEQLYSEQEWREMLDRAVQSLPPIFRTVFVLRDMDQLSTEEAAEVLQLSVPAVKSRLLRARLQLRDKLSKHFRRGTAA